MSADRHDIRREAAAPRPAAAVGASAPAARGSPTSTTTGRQVPGLRGSVCISCGGHRQIHVVGELPLVGTAATDAHAAAFTAGHRGAVGQRDGGVAAVPADHQ